MKVKYLVKFQDYEDIDFFWFEADDKLKNDLSRYFSIVAYGKGIKTIGKKINVIKRLKNVLGKRPVYTEEKDSGYDNIMSYTGGSFLYIKPPTKEMVELNQLLWDDKKKTIDNLISKLK